MNQKIIFLSFFVLIVLIWSGFINGYSTPYPFVLPKSLPKHQEPPNNPTTIEGAVLGKKLFYDVALSANNTISCASCHKQAFGFGDSTAFSKGIYGRVGKRNTLPLFNLAWQEQLFWDGRVTTLEDLVFHPLTDINEMGADTATLTKILNQNDTYPIMFAKAFGTPKITNKRISKAIAQYVRTLTSYEAKLDTLYEYLNNNFTNIDRNDVGKLVGYSPNVSKALILCEKCHNGESYGGIQIKNNGLDLVYKDEGNKSFGKAKKILFKVPSLRNLRLTAPYMHDGRFKTIEDVLEHYNSGIQASPNLSEELKDSLGNPIRLHLTEADKKQIIEFIGSFTHDPVFSTKPDYH